MESEHETVGFDSMLFRRSWVERNLSEADPTFAEEKRKAFVSPLGCGILVSDFRTFRGKFVKAFDFLAKDFKLRSPFLFLPSSVIIDRLGLPKAIAFVDKLVQLVQKEIAGVHVSFIILPVANDPTVTVGGLLSPAKPESSREYLVELQNPMPYLTAYSFRGGRMGGTFTGKMMMDSFESKRTRAWDRLVDADIEVYPHGDECNPLVCMADLMCFIVNFKLYGRATYEERKLDLRNVYEVLSEFSFLSTVHRFDDSTKEAYVHYNYRQIDYMDKVKHPVTYLIYNSSEGEGMGMRDVVTERLWYPAVRRAYMSEGSVKRFDWSTDAKYVDNGDTLVCVGEEALRKAKTLSMTSKVEILTGLQLREKTGI